MIEVAYCKNIHNDVGDRRWDLDNQIYLWPLANTVKREISFLLFYLFVHSSICPSVYYYF